MVEWMLGTSFKYLKDKKISGNRGAIGMDLPMPDALALRAATAHHGSVHFICAGATSNNLAHKYHFQ